MEKTINKRKVLLLLPVLLLLLFSDTKVYGQGPGFEDDTEDTVPLDGGLTIVAAGGIAYGVKKWRQRRKAGTAEEAAD